MQNDTTITYGSDANSIDSAAWFDDYNDLYKLSRLAFVTGLTSCIARGWTSHMTNGRMHVGITATPAHRVLLGEGLQTELVWHQSQESWGVEDRQDHDGRQYRIASIERSLYDLAANENNLGEDVVAECFQGAFVSEQKPSLTILREKASANPVVGAIIERHLEKVA